MKGQPPSDILPGYREKMGEGTQLVPDPEIWGKLTRREREIFIGVCQGLTDKQIAFRHDISDRTVKVHLRNIRKRVGAHGRVGLVTKVCQLKPPTLFGNVPRAMPNTFRELAGEPIDRARN